MKDSGIEWVGCVPTSWNIHPIYYYFSEHKQRNNFGDESNLLSLSYGKIIRKDINTTEGLLPESFNGYNIVSKGDIVLRLTDLQNDKRSLRTGLVKEKGIITSAYVTIRPKKQIDSNYFHYLLYAYDIVKVLYNMGNGVRQGLNYGELSKLNLIEPPLSDQRLITSFLDAKCAEIDALTAGIQQQIDALEQYKRSVITEAVTKGLNHEAKMKDSGIEWVGEIPEHWTFARIGGLYGLRVEKVSDNDFEPLSVTKLGVVPQLETAAKTNAHDDRKLVRKGDFVINSRSDRRGSCGISNYDGSVSLINTVLYPLADTNPQYYNWLFHTTEFADEFYRWGHGIVDDLWTTGWQDMKNIVIISPPMDEQKAIADYLDAKCAEIDGIISQKREQISTIEEYKKSLVFEYVTGKKEVPNNE